MLPPRLSIQPLLLAVPTQANLGRGGDGLAQAVESVPAPAASSQLLSFPRAHSMVQGIGTYCWEVQNLFCVPEVPSRAQTVVLALGQILCISRSVVLDVNMENWPCHVL